jgi:hypothetical protein
MVYVLLINGKLQDKAFTSLLGICKEYGLPYSTISRGKRRWIKADQLFEVDELMLCKIKGRGKQ